MPLRDATDFSALPLSAALIASVVKLGYRAFSASYLPFHREERSRQSSIGQRENAQQGAPAQRVQARNRPLVLTW